MASLQQRLDAIRNGFRKQAPPEALEAMHRATNDLAAVLAENPGLVGIGIDEGTGIIVKPDDTFEVAGGRSVIIYDACNASINIEVDQTISGYNLVMHILKAGDSFDLKARRVLK